MPTIEKNVPMPEWKKGEGISPILNSLEPGDSFLIPSDWNFSSVKSVAYAHPTSKFAIRTTPDGKRIWRLS